MKTRVFFALLFIANVAWGQDVKKAPRALSSESGRYVLGQISDSKIDQYLLDTKTGRVWQIQSAKRKTESGREYEEYVLVPILFHGSGVDGAVRDSPTNEPYSKP